MLIAAEGFRLDAIVRASDMRQPHRASSSHAGHYSLDNEKTNVRPCTLNRSARLVVTPLKSSALAQLSFAPSRAVTFERASHFRIPSVASFRSKRGHGIASAPAPSRAAVAKMHMQLSGPEDERLGRHARQHLDDACRGQRVANLCGDRQEALLQQGVAAASVALVGAVKAIALSPSVANAADDPAPLYTALDRSGFIGGIASVIESGIDLVHSGLSSLGISNSYGISICLFTVLIKALTFPLINLQIQTTARLSELGPASKRIYDALPDEKDFDRRNKMTNKLYKDAGVNPLASLWPVLVQIPVFFSLSRALRFLNAEGKLSEPFLWIPDLAGPRYREPTGKALEWVTSILSGQPTLGWDDTVAFLSLPIALLTTQKISQILLSPPRDLDRVMKDMPLSLQGPFGRNIVLFITENWPLIITFFFSLISPAGLTTYWLANNLLTTLIVFLVKAGASEEVGKDMKLLLIRVEDELKAALDAEMVAGKPIEKAARDVDKKAEELIDGAEADKLLLTRVVPFFGSAALLLALLNYAGPFVETFMQEQMDALNTELSLQSDPRLQQQANALQDQMLSGKMEGPFRLFPDPAAPSTLPGDAVGVPVPPTLLPDAAGMSVPAPAEAVAATPPSVDALGQSVELPGRQ